MSCTLNDLRSKEVINISDGTRYGFVDDAEIDTDTGQLLSILIPGGYRFFGVLGRENDIVIPWQDIKKIGDDIILVTT